MAADTLTINGVAINMADTNTNIDLLVPHVKGGVPELHFTRLLGPLTPLPDPWSGKAITLKLGATGATLQFAGDVIGYVERWLDGFGWVREYRAMGLAQRANYIPVTDSNTKTDTIVYNITGDDPDYIGARAGKTTGQIIAAVLTMPDNATALNAAGIGAYTSMGPPAVLPAATTADLATLTVIPPWRVNISGERILGSLENFLQATHPNHYLHVQPDGVIRFLDSRSFTATTLTIGGDPRLSMPTLTRDYSDCYSQVEVRGNTQVRAMALQTLPWPGSSAADGGLVEDFGYGAVTNAAAKAAWVPTDWSQPNAGIGQALALGSCTMPDTTHVVIATTLTLAANQLAQGAGQLLGQIQLFADSLGGLVSQISQARIVANTATSGGFSTLTLDIAQTSTAYGSYKLYGLTAGENVVGRRYKVTNASMASAMLNAFPYPMAYVSTNGLGAEMISSPMGIVMYNPFGGTSQPWNSTSIGITLDPDNGLIYFDMPTQVAAYGLNTPVQFAANVEAVVPIATGTLTAFAPSSTTYAGTLHTVEGIDRRKVITVLEWRDYSNQANMDTFASEFLDSVKDVVVEGTVPYHGLATAYLTPGKAVSLAGISGSTAYPTGWEALALPVVSVEVIFQYSGSGTSYETTLHLSNRRGRYSSENFLRPNVVGAMFGGDVFIGAGAPRYSLATPEGQRAEIQRQQAEAQQEFRDRYQNDPAFRKEVDTEQRRQATMNPWQRANEDLRQMFGGANQGLNQMFAGANQQLGGMMREAAQGPAMMAAQQNQQMFGGMNQAFADMGIDLGFGPELERQKNERMNREAGAAFERLPERP